MITIQEGGTIYAALASTISILYTIYSKIIDKKQNIFDKKTKIVDSQKKCLEEIGEIIVKVRYDTEEKELNSLNNVIINKLEHNIKAPQSEDFICYKNDYTQLKVQISDCVECVLCACNKESYKFNFSTIKKQTIKDISSIADNLAELIKIK